MFDDSVGVYNVKCLALEWQVFAIATDVGHVWVDPIAASERVDAKCYYSLRKAVRFFQYVVGSASLLRLGPDIQYTRVSTWF
jgi:hypothetical protein